MAGATRNLSFLEDASATKEVKSITRNGYARKDGGTLFKSAAQEETGWQPTVFQETITGDAVRMAPVDAPACAWATQSPKIVTIKTSVCDMKRGMDVDGMAPSAPGRARNPMGGERSATARKRSVDLPQLLPPMLSAALLQ